MKLARLHSLANTEPYWHVQLAVTLAIVLQLLLNDRLIVGPKYAIAGFELLLFFALAAFKRGDHHVIRHTRRGLAIVLIALISAANIASLVLVSRDLLHGAKLISGTSLIISALSIYITNIIIFGLWYWELDSAAPGDEAEVAVDFLFPQMASKDTMPALGRWNATFMDYLYVSMTNATAFSPTDTLPLTHRAKALMGLQSIVSLITVALVAARAVNILA